MKSYQVFFCGLSLLAMVSLGLAGQDSRYRKLEPELVTSSWQPPKTSIEANYLRVAKELLGNGLGDPRGCFFSEVTVDVGDGSGVYRNPVKGLGWVEMNRKWAVLLDGLEYKIVTLGNFVDPHKPIEDLVKTQGEATDSVGVAHLTPATPALILLAGDVDLAEQVFKAVFPASVDSPAYRLNEWLANRYQMQVAQSLIDHEDANGLVWARQLLTVTKIADREKSLLGLPTNTLRTPSLEFSRRLFADMLRRNVQAKIEPSVVSDSRTLNSDQRIAALIGGLDDVDPGPNGIGFVQGGAAYMGLLREGQKAIPALIDALRTDDRFTRAISVTPARTATRTIQTVTDVIRALILQIWPVSQRVQISDHVALASALKKAWAIDSKLTEAERWVEVLSDDKMSSVEWSQATRYLTSPSKVTRVAVSARVSGSTQPINGEPLRAKRGDEIASLIAKRALEVAAMRSSEPRLELASCSSALRMGHDLSVWSPKSATPTLAKLSKITLADLSKSNSNAGVLEFIAEPFAKVIADRLSQGDHSAISDYQAEISRVEPTMFFRVASLRPLWQFPNDAEVQASGQNFMDSMKAELMSSDSGVAMDLQEFLMGQMIESPLLTVASYRRVLASGMNNDVEAGEAWISNEGAANSLNLELARGRGSCSMAISEPPSGKRVKVSSGDYLTQLVAGVPGAPSFCMTWDPEKRRAAKKEVANWLLSDTRDWMALVKASPLYQMSRDLQ